MSYGRLLAIALLVLLFFPHVSCGQGAIRFLRPDTIFKRAKFDQRYVRDYSAYILPAVYLAAYNQNFAFNGKAMPRGPVNYEPSQPVRIGGSAFYGPFGFAFSLPLPMDPALEQRQGRTKASDFQFNLYFRRWGIDLAWQDYRKFYIDNSAAAVPAFTGDVKYQREDIKTHNLSANAFYVFNHKKFSYAAAFNQSERQLKSAGSFILGAGWSVFRLEADSAFIPGLLQTANNADLLVTRGNFSSAGVTLGYAHTFVIKSKFYISLGLTPGIAVGLMDWRDQLGNELKNTRTHFRLTFRYSIGFNGDRYYWGLNGFNDATQISFNENLNLTYGTANVFLFFGRRLSAEWLLLKLRLRSKKTHEMHGIREGEKK